MFDLKPPALRKFCVLEVELAPIVDMGEGRFGRRRIVPIVGGRVTGKGVSGKILNLGADWQTIAADGLASLEARYAFETDDGAIVEILNQAFRHGPDEVIARIAAGDIVSPDSYYMRSSARLETGHPEYAWLNRMVFVGTGARTQAAVQIDLYVVE